MQNYERTEAVRLSGQIQDPARRVQQIVSTAITFANTASVALDTGIANRVNAKLASAYMQNDKRNDD